MKYLSHFGRQVCCVLAICAAMFILLSPVGGPAGAAVRLSGKPYELMMPNSGSVNYGALVPAIADAINARGGIHGHPLKIVSCSDNQDPNQATVCAQQAIADPNMLGVIANLTACSSQLLPTLASAHMASVGDQLVCPEDFKSPVVFPFYPGTLYGGAGPGLAIKYLHDKNFVVTTIDVAAGREFPPLVSAIVGPLGGKVTGSVYIPFSAADMAPYAAQVVQGGGVMLDGNTTAIGIRLGKALFEQGFKEPVIYNNTTWSLSTIKKNFANAKNAYLETPYNFSSAGYKQFVSDVQKYDPKNATYLSSDLSTAWLAANVVARWANSVSDPTAPKLFKYLSTATSVNTYGMTIPLNFTIGADLHILGGGISDRIVNPCAGLYHYVNGSLVEVGKFADVLDSAGHTVKCSG